MVAIKYIAFCIKCGCPNEIPKYMISYYWTISKVGFHCNQCHTPNDVPDHLKKITKELCEDD